MLHSFVQSEFWEHILFSLYFHKIYLIYSILRIPLMWSVSGAQYKNISFLYETKCFHFLDTLKKKNPAIQHSKKVKLVQYIFVVLKADQRLPLPLLQFRTSPKAWSPSRTKGNQEEKREPGGLGKILANSAKKASLYLEEIKEVNPLSLRLNELG